jgi:hydrogenase maturation protease
MDRKEILILGIGNLLLRDEGVGIQIAHRLMEMDLPDNVEVIDGGTGGLNLIDYLEGRKKVIVIDATKAGGRPGTVYTYTDKDLDLQGAPMLSAHEIDFPQVLKTMKMLSIDIPEILFIGIEPEDLSDGIELSPVVERQVPNIIKMIIDGVRS